MEYSWVLMGYEWDRYGIYWDLMGEFWENQRSGDVFSNGQQRDMAATAFNGHIEIQLLQGCSSLLQVNDSHKGGKLIMLLHVTSLNLANLPPAPCMWRVGSDPQHPGIPPYVP